MASATGTLLDNKVELEAAFGLALADLPFDGYYVDVTLAIAQPTAFEPFQAVHGTAWGDVREGAVWEVRGRPWPAADGQPWSLIR